MQRSRFHKSSAKQWPLSLLSVTHFTYALLPLFALSAAADDAGNWSRFRGPDGTGISLSKKIPTDISKEVIDWSIKIKGSGHSSPVVVGDRIFLTSVVPAKNLRYVLCYNIQGKKLWEHETGFADHSLHRFNSFASSTPTVDNERVYVSWTTGERHQVVALTHDGKKVWERDLGFFSEEHGSSASPVIYKNTLLVSNDHAAEGGGFLAGLNIATGEDNWRIRRSAIKTSFSTPTIHLPDDGPAQAIFSSNPTALTAVDPESGNVLWTYRGSFRKDIRTVSSPVIAKGGAIVFATAGSGGGGKAGIAVRPPKDEDSEPELAWESRRGLPYVPTPIAYGDYLFLMADGGIMSCVDAETGDEKWKERITNETYSSPVCIDGKIYCFSRRGEMVVIAAKSTFEKLSEHDFEAPIHATPAVTKDKLYVRTDERLLSIGTLGQAK